MRKTKPSDWHVVLRIGKPDWLRKRVVSLSPSLNFPKFEDGTLKAVAKFF